jgi:hypothetical protein
MMIGLLGENRDFIHEADGLDKILQLIGLYDLVPLLLPSRKPLKPLGYLGFV